MGIQASPKGALKQWSFVFKGDRLTLTGPKPFRKREYSFKLDPSKKPKTIDLTLLDGQLNEKVWRGIYELKGDELTGCTRHPADPGDRPTGIQNGE
jgi:uncharacterized protein (TIGR03067 family)